MSVEPTEELTKFSRRVRMYKDGFISVCIYLTELRDGSRFYDTVIYRKIKRGADFEYKRGANLKPKDIPVLVRLLAEAAEFLRAELGSEDENLNR